MLIDGFVPGARIKRQIDIHNSLDMMTDGCCCESSVPFCCSSVSILETVSRNGVEIFVGQKKRKTKRKHMPAIYPVLYFSLHLPFIFWFCVRVFFCCALSCFSFWLSHFFKVSYISFVSSSQSSSFLYSFTTTTNNFHLMRTKTVQRILLSNYCFRSIVFFSGQRSESRNRSSR